MSLTPAGNWLNSNLMPDRLERMGMFSNCFYITSVKRGNDEISHTCLYSVLWNSIGNFSHSVSRALETKWWQFINCSDFPFFFFKQMRICGSCDILRWSSSTSFFSTEKCHRAAEAQGSHGDVVCVWPRFSAPTGWFKIAEFSLRRGDVAQTGSA